MGISTSDQLRDFNKFNFPIDDQGNEQLISQGIVRLNAKAN